MPLKSCRFLLAPTSDWSFLSNSFQSKELWQACITFDFRAETWWKCPLCKRQKSKQFYRQKASSFPLRNFYEWWCYVDSVENAETVTTLNYMSSTNSWKKRLMTDFENAKWKNEKGMVLRLILYMRVRQLWNGFQHNMTYEMLNTFKKNG